MKVRSKSASRPSCSCVKPAFSRRRRNTFPNATAASNRFLLLEELRGRPLDLSSYYHRNQIDTPFVSTSDCVDGFRRKNEMPCNARGLAPEPAGFRAEVLPSISERLDCLPSSRAGVRCGGQSLQRGSRERALWRMAG